MKKIAKIFVFALSMFLCMGYASAKEYIGVGKCTYTALWGKEELNSNIQENGIGFYFTDLAIRPKDDGPNMAKNYIFTRFSEDAKNQAYFQDLAFFNPFRDSASYMLETYDSYHTTFKTVYEKTGKCPTKLIYKKSGNDYKPIFTSNDIKSDCGSNSEATDLCPIVLKNTTSDIKTVTDDDVWTTNISGKNSCSNTAVSLTVDSDGYVKAKLVVAQDSKWYEKTKKSDIDVYVKTTGGTVAQMQEIYQLVNNNTFITAFYRTDKDNEKFYVSSETYSNNSCNLDSKVVFARGKSCALKSDLDVFTDYEKDIRSIYPNINSIYEELSSPGYTDSTGYNARNAYTYASESNVANLNAIVAKAGSVPSENSARVDAIKKELNSIMDGTHPALNGNKPCQDTIDEANKLLTRIANTASEYIKKIEVIKEAAANARKRAEELGATSEDLAAMDAILNQMEIIIERNKNVVENIRTSLLDNTNLNLSGLSNSGCDIISADMKKFLNTVLWYIRIAGVVLTIILSLLDYIKAATGSDDKSMASANKKFITRVILVAVLFLIPVLLEFLLSTLNISTTAGSISCLD